MKHTLLILVVFTLALTALHAQVLPGTIPGVDPAIQAAVDKAIPQQYAGYTSLVILSLMMIGRWIKALQNGTGIKGWFSAIWMGTNTNKPMILIACLCMLGLSSCSFFASQAGRQIIVSFAELGIEAALQHKKLSTGDALTISNGVAIVTDGSTTLTKAVKLSELGLNAAVDKNLVSNGDAVLIQEAGAIITKAINPTTPDLVPVTSGK